MPVSTFTPDYTYWGYIEKDVNTTLGTTNYTAYPAAAAVVAGYVYTSEFDGNHVKEYRAYYPFDTSSLPSDLYIEQIRWYVEVWFNIQDGTGPLDWKNGWMISGGGDISHPLVAADWHFGSICATKDWPDPPDSPVDGWVTMQSNEDLINPDGWTDFEIRDWSTKDGTNDYRTFWSKRDGILEVTWAPKRSYVIMGV